MYITIGLASQELSEFVRNERIHWKMQSFLVEPEIRLNPKLACDSIRFFRLKKPDALAVLNGIISNAKDWYQVT